MAYNFVSEEQDFEIKERTGPVPSAAPAASDKRKVERAVVHFSPPSLRYIYSNSSLR